MAGLSSNRFPRRLIRPFQRRSTNGVCWPLSLCKEGAGFFTALSFLSCQMKKIRGSLHPKRQARLFNVGFHVTGTHPRQNLLMSFRLTPVRLLGLVTRHECARALEDVNKRMRKLTDWLRSRTLKRGWRCDPRCDEERLTTRTLYTIFCGDQEKSERELKIFLTDLLTTLTTDWRKNEKPSGFLRAARSCGAWRIYLYF